MSTVLCLKGIWAPDYTFLMNRSYIHYSFETDKDIFRLKYKRIGPIFNETSILPTFYLCLYHCLSLPKSILNYTIPSDYLQLNHCQFNWLRGFFVSALVVLLTASGPATASSASSFFELSLLHL